MLKFTAVSLVLLLFVISFNNTDVEGGLRHRLVSSPSVSGSCAGRVTPSRLAPPVAFRCAGLHPLPLIAMKDRVLALRESRNQRITEAILRRQARVAAMLTASCAGKVTTRCDVCDALPPQAPVLPEIPSE